jgi:hypothetical protein
VGSSRPLAPACLPLVAALAVLNAVACTTQVDDFTTDADTGSTHALITVERNVTANGSASIRGGAFAGFVRIPPTLESKAVMRLVGLTLDFPAIGQCKAVTSARDAARLPQGYFEFVEAGDVRLRTDGGAAQLSPRAFPRITDLISGVVYTTRDRSVDALPAGVRYSISATGGGNLPALGLDAQAPRALENAAIGGIALGEVDTLDSRLPLDLTWAAGEPSDILVIELAAADGSSGTLCSFRDEAGAATIPAGAVQAAGAGVVALHRIRIHDFVNAGIDRGELRFDFTLRASLSFTR